jgi:rod shape-determining protein MreC
MESLFDRYRNLVVLLVVLVAQIAGLAMQVRRNESGRNSFDEADTRGVRLIRYWAESIVSPPQRMIHGGKLGFSDLWNGYIDLHRVRRQNQELQKTVDRLRLEQAELLEDARQGQRLQAMLGFQQHYIYTTVPAQVFGSSGTDQSKVFYIDKGSDDGMKRDMPVISADGIVGKVRDVLGKHMSQVLAVNDQTSGAGVILETTRIRGVLKGNAAGQLEIVGLLADQRIKPGEKVLTAGGDLIFPRGLPVGTVQKVVPDPDRDSFIDVMVTPAAHLDQLDEVLVITALDPRFPGQAQKDMATSEELKGAEAEAVKEQIKASAIMAERLPGLNDPNLQPGNAPTINGQQPNTPAPAANAATPPAVPAPKLLPTAHPDRFSPGGPTAAEAPVAPAPQSTPAAQKPPTNAPATAKPKQPQPAKPASQPRAGQSQTAPPSAAGRTQ